MLQRSTTEAENSHAYLPTGGARMFPSRETRISPWLVAFRGDLFICVS